MPVATNYQNAARMNREDILDIIERVEPEETPIYSSLNKGKRPSAEFQEWGVDTLKAPSFDGVPEGKDVDSFEDKTKDRSKIGNRIQVFRETWGVGFIQQQIAQNGGVAGVSNEKADAKAKCMLELKRSIESALGSDNDAAAGTGSGPGEGPKLRGLGSWTNASLESVPEKYRMPAGSTRATSGMTEAQFNGVLQSTYEASGNKRRFRLFSGPALQAQITGFTRAEGTATATPLQVVTDSKSKQLTFSVQRYEGDFGEVHVIGDLFLARTSGGDLTNTGRARGYLVPEGDLVTIGHMEAPFHRELEDKGGGPRGYCQTILTLVCKNPRGLGKFT